MKPEEVFLQEKPARLMVFLKEVGKPIYQAAVSKEIDSTYAHTLNILKVLNEMKLVEFEKSGRIKLVKLTELGEEVGDIFVRLNLILGLAELDKKIDQIYAKEVKGKLRGEINKDAILKQYGKIKEKLKEYFEECPPNISVLARKLATRIDRILAETLGYPPESYLSHGE